MGCKWIEVTTTVNQRIYLCDFCGSNVGECSPESSFVCGPDEDGSGCFLCGRYACRKHGNYRHQSPYGVSAHFCNACWLLGEAHRKQIEAMQKSIEIQRQVWREMARTAAGSAEKPI